MLIDAPGFFLLKKLRVCMCACVCSPMRELITTHTKCNHDLAWSYSNTVHCEHYVLFFKKDSYEKHPLCICMKMLREISCKHHIAFFSSIHK